MLEKRIPESEIEGAEQAQKKAREGLEGRHAARTAQAKELVENWEERDRAASEAARTPPPLTHQNR